MVVSGVSSLNKKTSINLFYNPQLSTRVLHLEKLPNLFFKPNNCIYRTFYAKALTPEGAQTLAKC